MNFTGFTTEHFVVAFAVVIKTPCSRVIHEKLIVAQLVKKYAAFYGTSSFVIVFTKARRILSQVI